jgi:hypothetical protein
VRIAERLDRSAPDTEHVLAGILSVPDALSTEILERLGVRSDDVLTALAARLAADVELLAVSPRRRRRRLLARTN